MSRNLVRTIVHNSVLAAAAAIALLAPPLAVSAIDLAASIPTGPEVRIGKLSNGLSYYIRHNAQPARRLELRLVVKAGSILEDDDQQGLAHFVEHMAFNGSTHFKRHEVVSYLQSIGMRFGADLNAFTSFDETWYLLPVPTARQEDIDKGFTILEDWAHGIAFEDADIDRERSVILEESRMHKGAGERVSRALMPKLFNGSRYAERLAIGKDELIRSFKPEALRRFYRDWYRPELMAVIAVGDVEPEELERQIRAHFGALRNPDNARPRTWEEIRPRERSEGLVVTDPELPVNSVAVYYPVRGAGAPGTYGGFRDKLLERLFESMLSQRLAELSQLPAPPYLGASSGLGQMTPRYRAYVSRATLGGGGTAPALAALVGEQQRARQYGFSEGELDRARKALLRAYERGYNERNGTASGTYAAEYMRHFLAGEALPGAEAEHLLVQELLPAITLEQVNAFVRATIPAGAGKLVAYVGGNAAAAPSAERLLAEVAAAEQAHVAAREDKTVATRLMAPPAHPGSIVAESTDKALGITRLTFSNGVKAIVKPTGFQQDQVLLSARRFGGQHLFDEQDLASARYAGSLVTTMGLKDFTPLELSQGPGGAGTPASNLQLGSDVDEVGGGAGSKHGGHRSHAADAVAALRRRAPRREPVQVRTWPSRKSPAQPRRDVRRRALATPWSTPVRQAPLPAARHRCWPTWRRSTSTAASRCTASASRSAKGLYFCGGRERRPREAQAAAGGLPRHAAVAGPAAGYRDVGLRFATRRRQARAQGRHRAAQHGLAELYGRGNLVAGRAAAPGGADRES
jgi:zinc protease